MKIYSYGDPTQPKSERNQEILHERLGGLTYESIADHFDITRERVRQIVTKLINRYDLVVPPKQQGRRCFCPDHYWTRNPYPYD